MLSFFNAFLASTTGDKVATIIMMTLFALILDLFLQLKG